MIATYLSILRRRSRLILLVTLVAAPLAYFAMTFGPQEYQSEASLLIGSDRVVDGVLGQGGGFEEPERRMATELEIIQGRVVGVRAAELLADEGWSEDAQELTERIEAAPRGFSRAIEIVGTDEDPQRAQQLTDAFVAGYLDYRQDRQSAELEEIEQQLVERLEQAEAELTALDAELAAGATVEGAREVALTRYETTANWLDEVRLLQAADGSGVEVLSGASLPEEASGEFAPAAIGVLAVMGALLLAAGLALILDLVRDAVRTRDEAERLGRAPTLAQIARPNASGGELARVLADPRHPTMGDARALRLRLEAGADEDVTMRVLVAGATSDADDVLMVGASFAAASARAGRRVLLVADQAFVPVLPDAPEPGSGVGSGGDVVRPDAPRARGTKLPGLWSAPASVRGTGERDGGGLLDGYSPASALRVLATDFDVIVVVPPADSDAFELMSLRRTVDTLLLVCSLGHTPGREFRRLVETLQSNQAPVDGLVLTAGRARRTEARHAPPEPASPPDAGSEVRTDPVAPTR